MTVMEGAPPSGLGVMTLDTAVVLGLSFCNDRFVMEGRKEGMKERNKEGREEERQEGTKGRQVLTWRVKECYGDKP